MLTLWNVSKIYRFQFLNKTDRERERIKIRNEKRTLLQILQILSCLYYEQLYKNTILNAQILKENCSYKTENK